MDDDEKRRGGQQPQYLSGEREIKALMDLIRDMGTPAVRNHAKKSNFYSEQQKKAIRRT
jgi:hypothetical protein